MEMVSMDALITKIMNFAQKLVDADRASLFLVSAFLHFDGFKKLGHFIDERTLFLVKKWFSLSDLS